METESKSLKVNTNKIKVTISGDGCVVFVVEVLEETRYRLLTASATNMCTRSVVV